MGAFICFGLKILIVGGVKRSMMALNIKTLLASVLIIMASTHAQSAQVEVEIYKFKYVPAEITINVGDTVVWINKEKRQYHNVWFKSLQEKEPDYLFPDERYEMSFDEKGIFAYECGPHPQMTGSVIVK